MDELKVTINHTELPIKEYKGQRVVTLKEIDTVHERPEGTARRNFNTNKEHLIEAVDFFQLDQPDEIRTLGIERPQRGTPQAVTLITESGYLMLVKSFTDDLAWTVQRQLVNTYFRATPEQRHEAAMQTVNMEDLPPTLRFMVELHQRQNKQEKALEAANQRIDGIREIVALSPNSWRADCRKQIVKIAQAMGGNEYIRDVNAEVYQLVDERAGVSLATRLTNKRRRMADEGVCKSKRDKLTKVDVIADDKKLIEIYLSVVKGLAIKYGVEWGPEDEA